MHAGLWKRAGRSDESEVTAVKNSLNWENHSLKPQLYIIAGCNGAGKTTASFTILPEVLDCREFVNADEIAKGLSPF